MLQNQQLRNKLAADKAERKYLKQRQVTKIPQLQQKVSQQVTNPYMQQLWRWPGAMGRPPAGVARAAFAVEQVGEYLYLCGGTTEDSDSKIPTDRVDVFHLPTQVWHRGPAMLEPRCNHGIVGLPNGHLAIGGGKNLKGPLATCEVLDPSVGKWAPMPALPAPQPTLRLMLCGSQYGQPILNAVGSSAGSFYRLNPGTMHDTKIPLPVRKPPFWESAHTEKFQMSDKQYAEMLKKKQKAAAQAP